MDPITTAILAALPAMASDTVKSAVKDAYASLKTVIQRKWGDTAPITKAVTALEQDPKSKAQAGVLEEKVASVKATEDPDVLQALHKLVEQLKAQDVGDGAVFNIQFTMSGGVVQGVAGAGTVNMGSQTFGALPKD